MYPKNPLKIVRTIKWIYQDYNIKDWCKKMNCISTHLEWAIQKWNQKNSSICNSVKIIKYIGINLTKKAQNLHCGNCYIVERN